MKVEIGGEAYNLKVSFLGSGFKLDRDLQKIGLSGGVSGAFAQIGDGGLSLAVARCVMENALVEVVGADKAAEIMSTYLNDNRPFLSEDGLVVIAQSILLELAQGISESTPASSKKKT